MVTATPDASSLAEVLDRILDKGIVVDVWARVSLVGIEILTVEVSCCRGICGHLPALL